MNSTRKRTAWIAALVLSLASLPAIADAPAWAEGATTNASQLPRGSFDGFSVSTSSSSWSLGVRGWAFDTANTSVPTQAHVYITRPDGSTTGYPVPADQSRPDVDQALHVGPNHGFSQSFSVASSGTYNVCVFAIGIFGNVPLGCKAQTIVGVPSPAGSLDETKISGDNITARGWTLDPNTPGSSIPAHIYVTAPDGSTKGTAFTADQARPDVNQALAVPGLHGFNATIPITQPGTYKVCAYGITVTPRSNGNTLLGCQTLQAQAMPSPIGSLDETKISGNNITARGWTLDPNTPGSSIPAHIYVTAPDGSTKGTAFTADQTRPDVNQALAVPGLHGYNATIPITQTGNYKVCAYGITITPRSNGNTLLGCQTLQAQAMPSPIGSQDKTPATPTSTYPTHTNVVSTSFWVGEIFNANISDGSQVCSTYGTQWAFHHTGKNIGAATDTGCRGAPVGGCDGVSSGTTVSTFQCATERRTSANGYFPTSQPTPLENPFYLDLPFDDVNDSTAFAQRCQVIPWAAADNAATGRNNCANAGYSYMKNRWVAITGPNGATCYGQIEDAGPSSGSLYHDGNYVFGSNNAHPANTQFSGDPTQGAGMDVSPALNGCLGFAALNGDNDHVSWHFVDREGVPAGPWLRVVTTRQVS